MLNKLPVPTEHEEAVILTEYLNLLQTRGHIVLFSHIPHETFTRSWNTKRKNKAEGVHKGVPDYLIITKTKIVFLELKRSKGGRVSEEQAKWLLALSLRGALVSICNGFSEAKQFIDSVIALP